jgi:hypothetical protein
VIGQVGRSYPCTVVVMGTGLVQFIPEYTSFLGWWPLLISQEWDGGQSGTGCMVPQSFTAGGNRSCPCLWAVTDDPWYPGY